MKTLKQTMKTLKQTLLLTICSLSMHAGAFAQPNEPGSGNCLEYNGSSDYVDCGNNISLNIDSNMTVSAWFKVNQVNQYQYILSKHRYVTATNSNGYYLLIHNNNKISFGRLDNGGTSVATITTISPNTWYYIVATYDATNGYKIYLNGILDNTQSSTNNIATDNTQLNIGRRGDLWPDFFLNGQIDEVRIWNYARSQTEIREDMCRKLQGNEPGLVCYWRFDEGSGSTAFDSSPNGNDGTLY